MKTHRISCLLAALLCCMLLTATVPAAAAGSPGQDWQLVSQIGGATKAALLQGNLLFVGSGRHVLAMDVTDPKNIMSLGQSPLLPQIVENIQSDGQGRLLVCCGDAGLYVLDTAAPSQLPVIASLDTRGLAESAAMVQGYALVADGPNGLQVVDLTNPANPRCVSQAYPLAYAYDVAVADGIAYIAAGGSGILRVDVHDPLAPVELGLTTVPGFQYDVEVSGTRLYAASAWGGVNAFTMGAGGTLAAAYTLAMPGWAFALVPWGDNWLVMGGADGALLYDLDSDAQTPLDSFYTGGFVLAGSVDGDLAVLLDSNQGMYAVTRPAGKRFAFASRWSPVLDAQGVLLNGNALYVAGGNSGLHTFDISDVASPRETQQYMEPRMFIDRTMLDGGNLFTIASDLSDAPLIAFGIADPLKPSLLNTHMGQNSGSPSPVVAGQGRRYLPFVNGRDQYIIDVTDPKNPFTASIFHSDDEVCDAVISGNLYVSSGNNEIYFLDCSDPTNMKLLYTITRPSWSSFAAFYDPQTVLLPSPEGLWVMDVTDPENPAVIGRVKLTGQLLDIFIDGQTAYISSIGYGVQVVDLSRITAPKLIATIPTQFETYASAVQGDLLAMADTFGGVSIYRRGEADSAASAPANAAPIPLMLAYENSVDDLPSKGTPYLNSDAPRQLVVTSTANGGAGSLREVLQKLTQGNATVTFDPSVFPPDAPATIHLTSELPPVQVPGVTIDASNAGVILDGSQMSIGSCLTVSASGCTVMGLQIIHFPQNGLTMEGDYNRVGGNRDVGSGPCGQGNVIGGNGNYGLFLCGNSDTVQGNTIGADATGTQENPNRTGVWAEGDYLLFGSTVPGEGNLISGNTETGVIYGSRYGRVIGNLFGLDRSGTAALGHVDNESLFLTGTSRNNVIGGTTPAERNVFAGGDGCLTLTGPQVFQNSIIGNYCGTDVTGEKPIGSDVGIGIGVSNFNRIGGTAPGEGNLICGNSVGIGLGAGYGDEDNPILGNRIGLNVSGDRQLSNNIGIEFGTGYHRGVVGGWTAAEGNLIVGGSNGVQASDLGIRNFYIAGNTISGGGGNGVFLARNSSGNFVQGNLFTTVRLSAVRIDSGDGNLLRINRYTGAPKQQIDLNKQANQNLAAPKMKKAKGDTVTGTACPAGWVELYLYDAKANALSPYATVTTDADGVFTYTAAESLKGKMFALLASDALGNTSIFSKPFTVR